MTSDDIRATNLDTVTGTLAALSRLDVPAALAGVHPDLRFELPYEKAFAPLDRDGFATMIGGLAGSFRRFALSLVEVVPALDPDVLVVRYEGDCVSTDGSVEYRNSYVAFLDFTDGLISRWREYANPVLTRRMNEQLAAVRSGS